MTKILVAILSLLVVWIWQKNETSTSHQAVVEKAKTDSATVIQIDGIKTVRLETEIGMTNAVKHDGKTCVSIN